MEGTLIGFIFDSINAIGTFLIGIAAIIGVFRIALRITFKNEVLFGKEAQDRFDKIKHNLKDDRLVDNYIYDGGDTRIFPQLIFSRCINDPKLIDPKFKGSTKSVRFYYNDPADNVRKVKIWYLK